MDKSTDKKNINIGKETVKNLITIRRWTLFLSIAGFIFFGLFVAIGIVAVIFHFTFFPEGEGGFFSELLLTILFLASSVIFCLSMLYLHRLTMVISSIIRSNNKQDIIKAVDNLKLFFVFLGILLIMVLACYLIVIMVSVSATQLPSG
jgi:hypothetical protein